MERWGLQHRKNQRRILLMDRANLTAMLQAQAKIVWRTLGTIYPDLQGFSVPEIKLNGRLWRTAGCNYQDQNRVELGYKFFLHGKEYYDTMFQVILPHELIHQADYNLFGTSEKKCGHGKNWRDIMIAYGLEPNPHHEMDIPRK